MRDAPPRPRPRVEVRKGEKCDVPLDPWRGNGSATGSSGKWQAGMNQATYPDLDVTLEGHVATVEIRRPPNNFFDTALISAIADAFEDLDRQTICRAIVLGAQGRAFCAGADLSKPPSVPDRDPSRPPPPHLYKEAARLFRARKPVVAAVHGDRRRVGACAGGGFSRHLHARTLRCELQPVGLSPRLWPDRDAAALGWAAARRMAILYRPAHPRGRSRRDGTGRSAGCRNRSANPRAGLGAGDRAICAACGAVNPSNLAPRTR